MPCLNSARARRRDGLAVRRERLIQDPDRLGRGLPAVARVGAADLEVRCRLAVPTGPRSAWTDITWLLHAHHVSWARHIQAGTQPDCANGAALTCAGGPGGPRGRGGDRRAAARGSCRVRAHVSGPG
jgi:hypothetical protein